MARRIQLAEVTQDHGGYTSSTIFLRVFAPTGRLELEHDRDSLLLAIAAVVLGAKVPDYIGWTLNGVYVSNDAARQIQNVIRGADKDVKPKEFESKQTQSRIFFDASEFVGEGRVAWRLAMKAPNSPFQKADVLTPAEMLYCAAASLLNPKAP